MPKEHGDSGEFVETVTLADVRAVFDEVRGPAILSADVADALDCSRETARRKLERLYEQGDVDRRKVSRRVVYWNTGGERITPDERGNDADAEQARDVRDRRRQDDDDAPESDAVERVAEEWEDTDERLEARKAAARAVLEYAREHGEVSKQDATDDIYPEFPVEGQDARTWYRKNIRPVLNEAAEYDQSTRAYQLVDDVEP